MAGIWPVSTRSRNVGLSAAPIFAKMFRACVLYAFVSVSTRCISSSTAAATSSSDSGPFCIALRTLLIAVRSRPGTSLSALEILSRTLSRIGSPVFATTATSALGAAAAAPSSAPSPAPSPPTAAASPSTFCFFAAGASSGSPRGEASPPSCFFRFANTFTAFSLYSARSLLARYSCSSVARAFSAAVSSPQPLALKRSAARFRNVERSFVLTRDLSSVTSRDIPCSTCSTWGGLLRACGSVSSAPP